MSLAAITTCQRSFREHVSPICERSALRLHWAIVNALGIQPSDVIHASQDLKVFSMITNRIGNQFSKLGRGATISIVSQISEIDLVNRSLRLQPGHRLVVYNHERDLDAMPQRSFDAATACFFDQASKKVVRIFDGPPRRVSEYVHIELSEHSDSSLSMQASRIASLR